MKIQKEKNCLMALPRTTSEESSHPNSSHSKKEHPEIHIARLPTQSSLPDFQKSDANFGTW